MVTQLFSLKRRLSSQDRNPGRLFKWLTNLSTARPFVCWNWADDELSASHRITFDRSFCECMVSSLSQTVRRNQSNRKSAMPFMGLYVRVQAQNFHAVVWRQRMCDHEIAFLDTAPSGGKFCKRTAEVATPLDLLTLILLSFFYRLNLEKEGSSVPIS